MCIEYREYVRRCLERLYFSFRLSENRFGRSMNISAFINCFRDTILWELVNVYKCHLLKAIEYLLDFKFDYHPLLDNGDSLYRNRDSFFTEFGRLAPEIYDSVKNIKIEELPSLLCNEEDTSSTSDLYTSIKSGDCLLLCRITHKGRPYIYPGKRFDKKIYLKKDVTELIYKDLEKIDYIWLSGTGLKPWLHIHERKSDKVIKTYIRYKYIPPKFKGANYRISMYKYKGSTSRYRKSYMVYGRKIWGDGPTDIENIMEGLLEDLGFKEGKDYEYQYPFPGSNYIVDFAFPSKKIAVECDGTYWHNMRGDKDKVRDAFMQSRGWTVLRFNDIDLTKNTVKVKRILREHLLR